MRDSPLWLSATLVVALSLAALLLPLIGVLHAAEGDGVPITRNDTDDDRVVDTADLDDDNDGIPDTLEISPDGSDRDSDGDGRVDRLDLDSDNDGILDWQESGASISLDLSSLRPLGGRLAGEVGENGLIDVFESPRDTGRLAYALVDTDLDGVPNVLDLDSDQDGLSDLDEAGVASAYDGDRDARIDAPPGSVGTDGIADYLQSRDDRSCCDVTGDGIDDIVPRDTDGTGLPDYMDLDSDDDGVSDLVETGGTDRDGDGRIDNVVDTAPPDGLDDALLVVPPIPTDVNGNALPDHLDPFAPGPPPEPAPVAAPPAPAAPDTAGTPGNVDANPIVPDPIVPDPADPVLGDPASGADGSVQGDDADPQAGDQTTDQAADQATDQPTGVIVSPAAEEEPDAVLVGLDASGCSLAGSRFDPSLALLAALALLPLVRRGGRHARRERTQPTR